MMITITPSGQLPFFLLMATFTGFGYGMGLVSAAGKPPRNLYISGTIVTLAMVLMAAFEFYVFILGPAFADKSG